MSLKKSCQETTAATEAVASKRAAVKAATEISLAIAEVAGKVTAKAAGANQATAADRAVT